MPSLVRRRTLSEITAGAIKNEQRPSAAARGYGHKWQKYARRFLENHPLCARCAARDVVTVARCVDHITPVTGPDDPSFWKKSNHQPLCFSCHSIKTQSEDRWRGRRR